MSSEPLWVGYGAGGNQRLLRSGQPDTQHHGTRKPRPGTALFYLTDTGSLGPKIIAAAYFIVFARYSNASEYAEVSSMEVGFRRKSQDTDTIRVDFTSNRFRKLVVASRTAIPSSSSSRPKYQDKLSSLQPYAFLYSYPLALNALNQQVIKPSEQVGTHKYFSGQNNFSPWTHPCESLSVTHSSEQALVHDLALGRNTILVP